jgi:hypothetical protein
MHIKPIHSLNPESLMGNNLPEFMSGNALPRNRIRDYGTEQLRRFATDTDHRKHITYSFIINITCWLSVVISVLYFNNYLLKLQLSDSVLIMLLTTSTLNVIGMMMIILKNLFPIENVS